MIRDSLSKIGFSRQRRDIDISEAPPSCLNANKDTEIH